MDVRGSAAPGCGIGGALLELSGRQSDTPGCVRSRVGAAEHSGSGIRVGGVSGRDRSHASLGILLSLLGPRFGFGSNRFEGGLPSRFEG